MTGEVKILSDQIFSSIVVYQDMIYCRYVKGSKSMGDGVWGDEVDYWFYLFDQNEFVAANTSQEYALNFQRYGEYFLAATLQEDEKDPRYDIQVGMELRKWDGGRGEAAEELASMMFRDYYVKDGKFHWLDSEGFHIWEPVSGDAKVYPWNKDYTENYILVGNLFFSTKSRLMDLDEGSEESWKSNSSSIKILHEVYTDGSQIYAIGGGYGSEADRNSYLRRVLLTKAGDKYGASFEALQE